MIRFSVEHLGTLYDITINDIGEMEDLPDGGGNIPIEYSVEPTPLDEKTSKHIESNIGNLINRAISSFIEENNEEDSKSD